MTRDREALRRARRHRVARHPRLVGLEHVDVAPEGHTSWTLRLYFVATRHATKVAVPADLAPANLSIEPLHGPKLRIRGIEAAGPGNPMVLVHVSVESAEGNWIATGWRYRLRLQHVPDVDPKFDSVEFNLPPAGATIRPSERPVGVGPPELAGARASYLAKDYESFRTLMLDRLAVVAPEWRERNPADIGVMLVEVLAYAADMLSYRQDAISTEAYLGTAREPVSLRRHARLLDYVPVRGGNAAVWVQFWANAEGTIPRGTALIPNIGADGVCVSDDAPAYLRTVADGTPVFETLHELHLDPACNRFRFYTWGSPDYVLPRGATGATLWSPEATLHPNLQGEAGLERLRPPVLAPGDVLVLQETRSPVSGLVDDADVSRRHAVRLTRVTMAEDQLGSATTGKGVEPVRLIEIEWHAEDALPFELTVSGAAGGRPFRDGARAHGNIVLADHGRSVGTTETAREHGAGIRLTLATPGVTRAVPYDHASAVRLPAVHMMHRDPVTAVAAVKLTDRRGQDWTPRRDLLGSGPFSRDFVVELSHADRATLRFGDGRLGQAPAGTERFEAQYRLGYGTAGNIGPDTLDHIVTSDAQSFDDYNRWVSRVNNPLPARGGVGPEPDAEVRRNAPHAFHRQKRCVVPEDYVALAGQHPEVARASAVLRWTGSWTTAFIYVQRREGRPEDGVFLRRVTAFLERYRLTGIDLDVRPPDYVPLDIVLEVRLQAGSFRNVTEQRLLARFGASAHDADGFFAPGRFTFGQTLYLSQMVAAAMAVPGVRDVRPVRFARLGDSADPSGPRQDEIHVGAAEILRADNDPRATEHGRISLLLSGGR